MTEKQLKVYSILRNEFVKDYFRAIKDWDYNTVEQMDKEGFQGWDRYKDALMDAMLVCGYSAQSVNKMLKDPNTTIVKVIDEQDEMEVQSRNMFGLKVSDLVVKSYLMMDAKK